jgi:uncharacterized protein (DUF433 family)
VDRKLIEIQAVGWLVLDLLASGMSIPEVLAQYPGLVEEDIRACIAYGAKRSREHLVLPARGAA